MKEIIEESKAILLYFENSECSVCKNLLPKIKELIHTKYPEMEFCQINVQLNPEFVSEFQIFATPLILVFFEGKEFFRFSKYISIEEIDQQINRIYSLYFS